MAINISGSDILALGGAGRMNFNPEQDRKERRAERDFTEVSTAANQLTVQDKTRQLSEQERIEKGYNRMAPLIEDFREFFTIKGVDRDGDNRDGYEALKRRAESIVNNPEMPQEMKDVYGIALQAVNQGKGGVKQLAQRIVELEAGVAGLNTPLGQSVKNQLEGRRKRAEQRRLGKATEISAQNAETSAMNADTSRMQAEQPDYVNVGPPGGSPTMTIDRKKTPVPEGMVVYGSASAASAVEPNLLNVGPPGQGPTMVVDGNTQAVPEGMVVYGEAKQGAGGGSSISISGSGGAAGNPATDPSVTTRRGSELSMDTIEQGTGPIDRLVAVVQNSVAGKFFEETPQLDARNQLKNLEKDITEALAISNRMPVAEQNQLKPLAVIGGFFQSEQGATSQVRSILGSLEQGLAEQTQLFEQSQDTVQKRKIADKINRMQQTYNKLVKLVTPVMFQRMSDEELQAFIEMQRQGGTVSEVPPPQGGMGVR